jgi:mannose-1-phosphate guanylyltransferase
MSSKPDPASAKSIPVIALLLAGGAGTRFWPASRAARPKQLLPLAGVDPLLRRTALRVLPLLSGWQDVLVATGAHLVEATAAVLPELPQSGLLVEPCPRNTAPCIAWAAARVARSAPETVLMVLPSDHHVADEEGFRATLAVAIASAAAGVPTTIGIRPTRPETGYGYIELEPGAAVTAAVALPARGFVEKPDRARAEAFLEGGRHLWNAGMFFFRAGDLLAEVRRHLPELAAALDRFDAAARVGEEAAAVDELFPALPSVSIDHGVMEHLQRMAVVPGDFGWSDVGSWQSAWELADKDADGNSAPRDAVLVDAHGNHVVDLRSGSGRRVIALVGVEDLVVVETDDALLIASRAVAQDVKAVVDRLKGSGRGGLT